jgi:hypothetical protein
MKDKDAHLMMEALRAKDAVKEAGAISATGGDRWAADDPQTRSQVPLPGPGKSNIAAAFAQLKIDIADFIDASSTQGPPVAVQKQIVGQIIDRAEKEAETGERAAGQPAAGDPSGDYDYNPQARL